MKDTRRTLLPLALTAAFLLAAGGSRAGVILNTLQGYDPTAEGWSGRLDGLFSGSGGNTERISVETAGKVQLVRGPDRYRLLAGGGYQENNGQETARSAVVHLRHNHELGGHWASIAFGQLQHNPFQRLQSRWLAGLGARYDFARDEKGLFALGATPMLEITRLSSEDGHTARGRLSVFLQLARRLTATTRLDATAFWQPLLADWGASRTVGNVTLTVAVAGGVELKVGAAVEDNARPPRGVVRTDWSTFTGLGIGF